MSQESVESIRRLRCDRCGIDLQTLWEARGVVADIVEYMRGKDGAPNVAITPSLERNATILETLDWVLGVDRGGFFLGYLNALRNIRPDVLWLMRKPMDHAKQPKE